MNTIDIKKYESLNLESPLDDYNQALAAEPLHLINQTAWQNKAYTGEVFFSILHTTEAIAIKFLVKEKELIAKYQHINDPVYKDSCVEFFISLNEQLYYNFEFNANGVCLVQKGSSKTDRTFLSTNAIQQIKNLRNIKKTNEEELTWELLVIIPKNIFIENVNSFDGETYAVNFYKCGDETAAPHFLCWQKIDTLSPDFHQPKYFGQAIFKH